jgi:mono/diheme cytochrome c family protein
MKPELRSPRRKRSPSRCWGIAAALSLVLIVDSTFAQDAPRSADDEILRRGAEIYKASCVSCHGDKGQGVEGSYPDPLVGDSTTGELASLITDTMPEEDPESCVGEDAKAVAAYVHHAFYSEAAQIRNRPPRITLARLTAEQLRQSISDLYARLDGVSNGDQEHGLSAIYFKGAGWNNDKKAIERKDPVIEFDFGMDGPGEGIEGNDFYIHWSGAILAPQSGRYEFVIRSSSAFKFEFGNDGRVLIDNGVQSGDQTEFRKAIHLTGGRIYPVKLELFQRKRKNDQPPSSIQLAWAPPGGVEHTIPSDNLLSGWNPAAYSLQTKLPADDRSYGYERGTAINRDWDDSTTAAALEFAEIATSEMWPRYRRKHKDVSDENRARLKAFLSEIVRRASRCDTQRWRSYQACVADFAKVSSFSISATGWRSIRFDASGESSRANIV